MSEVVAIVGRRELFTQPSLVVRAGPFALAAVLALVAYPFGADATYGTAFVVGVVLLAAMVVAIVLPWERLPRVLQMTPLLLYLGGLAALNVAHGGPGSGYQPLFVIAVVWAALFGLPVEAAATVVALGLAYLLPRAIDGGLTASDWRRALFALVSASVAAFVIQATITALLDETARRGELERTLARLRAHEIHDDIVQGLTAAQLGLQLERADVAAEGVATALASAQRVVRELITDGVPEVEPGTLRRDRPAD